MRKPESAFDLGAGTLDSPSQLFNSGKATGAVWDSGDPLLIVSAAGGDVANIVGFAMAGALMRSPDLAREADVLLRGEQTGLSVRTVPNFGRNIPQRPIGRVPPGF